VVFAALGPNPAPLTELLWALAHERRQGVRALFLVVDHAGLDYLQHEVLAPGAALDELQDVLGRVAVGAGLHDLHIETRLVQGQGGAPLDDEDPAHADRYNAAVWEQARAATVAAGDGTVVFALTAGRRRTMTAMSTMAFQLLARAQDVCVDVRVSDPRAEGGSGFFFPTQRAQALTSRAGVPFLANHVRVQLVDVVLPRLRGLLGDHELASYSGALAAGQAAVDAASPPQLVVDLVAGEVRVDGTRVPFSTSEFAWFAALALARRRGDGRIETHDFTTLRQIMTRPDKCTWVSLVSDPLSAVLASAKGGLVDDTDLALDLAKLKANTRKRMQTWCRAHRPAWEPLLVPLITKRHHPDTGLTYFQQLPLAGGHVTFVGLSGA
jgi:CRISPR-associated protein (TIGR02584 family)